MKHNDAVIRQYCRAVGKQLPLPAAQRRQLLAGLREELTESAQDCTTLDELIARVGTPDEAAQELLSGIAPERVQAYQKKLRRRSLLAAVLIVLAVYDLAGADFEIALLLQPVQDGIQQRKLVFSARTLF